MNTLKEEAIILRKAGYSYSIIGERLKISKSTLSNWLALIPFSPNEEVSKKVGNAKLKSALYKQALKFEDIAKMKLGAKGDVGVLSQRDQFMLGIGLYMGEGSKSFEQVRVVNADPVIIRTAIAWLKTSLKLERENFRITIHAYPDTNPAEAIKFWSEQTKIPKNQFSKLVIDTRENKSKINKRKLPYGTATVYLKNNGNIFPSAKSLHRKIMGWIDSTTQQI